MDFPEGPVTEKFLHEWLQQQQIFMLEGSMSQKKLK